MMGEMGEDVLDKRVVYYALLVREYIYLYCVFILHGMPDEFGPKTPMYVGRYIVLLVVYYPNHGDYVPVWAIIQALSCLPTLCIGVGN